MDIAEGENRRMRKNERGLLCFRVGLFSVKNLLRAKGAMVCLLLLLMHFLSHRESTHFVFEIKITRWINKTQTFCKEIKNKCAV